MYGEVVAPGLYELFETETLTASKAILKAGGFTKWAKKSAVRVIRANPNLPESEREIVIDISAIMLGDRSSDIILQPNDIINVRERLIAFSR